jgi:HK97 family phage prohead protease
MTDFKAIAGAPERRAVAAERFETRAKGDTLTLEGYASVFDAPYDVYGGPPYGFTEVVDRRAFNKTLADKPDLHLLINHEGLPLARTKSGTLSLSVDERGLKVFANLDRRDPDVQKLEVKMDRGDLDEMSFAFRTLKDEWTDDDSERRLLEVSLDKGDVSIVNFGANPATTAGLRDLDAALEVLAELVPADALAEVRSMEGATDRLAAAHKALGQLMKELTGSRTLSVADAEKMLAGRT